MIDTRIQLAVKNYFSTAGGTGMYDAAPLLVYGRCSAQGTQALTEFAGDAVEQVQRVCVLE
jgi:hypothetical protein